ncbi:protein kinase domain-containing protein [Nephila pilipes]|uniref:Protein kinase domain-containing protein n=1 Tax=Nephila pilipes TaxID=299642 RepID=A0A8X6P4Z9_NEPPI|nr:protein kinase domain-containing protein [Nephila pilipes]
MYDPERESDVAVKIVTSENIAESELAMWPKLHHPNIVPLLELMTLKPLDVAIFVMPVQKKTLHDMMYDKRFLNRNDSLDFLKIWLYEILCALEYLDSRYLCHLDIKVDNVLISREYTAMICDFSFLNSTIKPLERYDLGLPYIYRPPEACQSIGNDIVVDGRSYDMWGFGIMTLEIFTHFILAANIPDCSNWVKEVYPTIFNTLQEREFIKLMIQTFPGYDMSLTQIKLALNFIHSFLMYIPSERASPIEALQHQFLNRGVLFGPITDSIWIHKIQVKSMELPTDRKRKIKFSIPLERIVDANETQTKINGSGHSTDDEYLTVSDSDEDTKDTNSNDECMENLSEKDHSTNVNTPKIKKVPNKSTEVTIKELLVHGNSDAISDNNLSHMEVNENDKVSVSEKIGEKKICQLQSVSSLQYISQVNKPYNSMYHLSRHVDNVEQFKKNSKRFPQLYLKNIPNKLKKQYGETQNNFRMSRESFIPKRTYMRPRFNKYYLDEAQLRYIPNSEFLIRKFHERKNVQLSSNDKNKFYRIPPRNAHFYENRDMDTHSHIENSSESSVSNSDSKTGSENTNLSQSDSQRSETSVRTEICTPGNEESPHMDNMVDEKMEINDSNTKTEINSACKPSKFGTGDPSQTEFDEIINLEDINVPTTSQEGLVSVSTKDEESTLSTDIRDDTSQFMTSVTHTLGQLNQINDILQKVMICENCNSKRRHHLDEAVENDALTEISPNASNSKNQENTNQVTDAMDVKVFENLKNKDIINSDIFPNEADAPFEIKDGQNLNLIINCPIVKKKVLNMKTTHDATEEKDSESKLKNE